MPIRIFIVEDHPLLRQGLIQILSMEDNFLIIGSAATGEEALNNIPKKKNVPDVILLDMNLPDMSGVDLVRSMPNQNMRSKVLVLTVNDASFYVVEMLKLGVHGYALKGIDPEDLINAIHTVSNGDFYIDPTLEDIIMDIGGNDADMVKKARDFCLENHETRLTIREMEVIRLIAAGMSNIEMASQLFVSDKTIKNHLTNIYRKLGVTDRTQALIYAYKNGLLCESDGFLTNRPF